MFFIYDEVLNARAFLKRKSGETLKSRFQKVKFYIKHVDAMSLPSNRFLYNVLGYVYAMHTYLVTCGLMADGRTNEGEGSGYVRARVEGR